MPMDKTGKQDLQYSYQTKQTLKQDHKESQKRTLMVKRPIQEEDITIINIYVPNIGAPRYLQQILTDIKGEMDGNTITAGDFSNPLTSRDTSSRQKITKATEILKETVEKLDLTNIFRILLPKKQNIPSSQVHMEHSQELIMSWGTKLTTTCLRV